MVSESYRKSLKLDLEAICEGVDPKSFHTDTFIALMRVLRDKVRTSIVRGSVTPLMHFVYENFEKSASRLDATKLACRKGCSHCCNIWTDAYAPEIFFAAKQVAGVDNRKVSNLLKDTGEFSAKVSFEERERLPIPCPMLAGNECGLYRFRPLNCRTAISLDEEACRRAFLDNEEVEIPLAQGWSNLGQFYSMALKGALFHAGLPCEPYELNSALALAVNDHDLEKRWLSGEDVFNTSPIATLAAPFTHPFWRSLYDRAFLD